MPSKIKNRPLEQRERYFIDLFIKQDADEGKIAACEKRAHLKAGSGKEILKRKSVKAEIKAKLEPARQQQFRQSIISDSVNAARLMQEQVLKEKIALIRNLKIDNDILEGSLLEGVLVLDWNRSPEAKLNVIKAAAVWKGVFKASGTERLAPKDDGPGAPSENVYVSLFNRLASAPPVTDTPPAIDANAREEGVYDLYPPKADAPAPKTIAASTEKTTVKPANSNIITVEVG